MHAAAVMIHPAGAPNIMGAKGGHMTLDSAMVAAGRLNNFNLIRLMAAWCVLVSHSVVLATGEARLEPLRELLGVSLGGLSVAVFFIASGLLVGGSLIDKGDPIRYVVARSLRIYPGLLAAVAFTLMVGLAVTTLSLGEFFSSGQTWKYIAKTGTAIAGVTDRLPGVFLGNPFPGAVNGSLWTLPHELRMYAALLLIWLAVRAVGQIRFAKAVFAALALLLLAVHFADPEWVVGRDTLQKTLLLGAMFFLGVLLHIMRRVIRLNRVLAVVAVCALVAAALHSHGAFRVVYPLAFAYLIVFVAYGLPPVKWTLGADYSYGVYVYAFPIQQLIVLLMPGASHIQVTATATVLVLVMAVLSWHFIEKRALEAVPRATAWSRGLLGRPRLVA